MKSKQRKSLGKSWRVSLWQINHETDIRANENIKQQRHAFFQRLSLSADHIKNKFHKTLKHVKHKSPLSYLFAGRIGSDLFLKFIPFNSIGEMREKHEIGLRGALRIISSGFFNLYFFLPTTDGLFPSHLDSVMKCRMPEIKRQLQSMR